MAFQAQNRRQQFQPLGAVMRNATSNVNVAQTQDAAGNKSTGTLLVPLNYRSLSPNLSPRLVIPALGNNRMKQNYSMEPRNNQAQKRDGNALMLGAPAPPKTDNVTMRYPIASNNLSGSGTTLQGSNTALQGSGNGSNLTGSGNALQGAVTNANLPASGPPALQRLQGTGLPGTARGFSQGVHRFRSQSPGLGLVLNFAPQQNARQNIGFAPQPRVATGRPPVPTSSPITQNTAGNGIPVKNSTPTSTQNPSLMGNVKSQPTRRQSHGVNRMVTHHQPGHHQAANSRVASQTLRRKTEEEALVRQNGHRFTPNSSPSSVHMSNTSNTAGALGGSHSLTASSQGSAAKKTSPATGDRKNFYSGNRGNAASTGAHNRRAVRGGLSIHASNRNPDSDQKPTQSVSPNKQKAQQDALRHNLSVTALTKDSGTANNNPGLPTGNSGLPTGLPPRNSTRCYDGQELSSSQHQSWTARGDVRRPPPLHTDSPASDTALCQQHSKPSTHKSPTQRTAGGTHSATANNGVMPGVFAGGMKISPVAKPQERAASSMNEAAKLNAQNQQNAAFKANTAKQRYQSQHERTQMPITARITAREAGSGQGQKTDQQPFLAPQRSPEMNGRALLGGFQGFGLPPAMSPPGSSFRGFSPGTALCMGTFQNQRQASPPPLGGAYKSPNFVLNTNFTGNLNINNTNRNMMLGTGKNMFIQPKPSKTVSNIDVPSTQNDEAPGANTVAVGNGTAINGSAIHQSMSGSGVHAAGNNNAGPANSAVPAGPVAPGTSATSSNVASSVPGSSPEKKDITPKGVTPTGVTPVALPYQSPCDNDATVTVENAEKNNQLWGRGRLGGTGAPNTHGRSLLGNKNRNNGANPFGNGFGNMNFNSNPLNQPITPQEIVGDAGSNLGVGSNLGNLAGSQLGSLPVSQHGSIAGSQANSQAGSTASSAVRGTDQDQSLDKSSRSQSNVRDVSGPRSSLGSRKNTAESENLRVQMGFTSGVAALAGAVAGVAGLSANREPSQNAAFGGNLLGNFKFQNFNKVSTVGKIGWQLSPQSAGRGLQQPGQMGSVAIGLQGLQQAGLQQIGQMQTGLPQPDQPQGALKVPVEQPQTEASQEPPIQAGQQPGQQETLQDGAHQQPDSSEQESSQKPCVVDSVKRMSSQKCGISNTTSVPSSCVERKAPFEGKADAVDERLQRVEKTLATRGSPRKAARKFTIRYRDGLARDCEHAISGHWAIMRIQRWFRVLRWKRKFYDYCANQLDWVGSLDWLQKHGRLYGTELAEEVDLEAWDYAYVNAQPDITIDPWGNKRLRDHLNRMWYGSAHAEYEQQQYAEQQAAKQAAQQAAQAQARQHYLLQQAQQQRQVHAAQQQMLLQQQGIYEGTTFQPAGSMANSEARTSGSTVGRSSDLYWSAHTNT